MKRIVRIGVIPILIVAVVSGIAAWRLRKTGSETTTLQTAPVIRSDLVATIGATGTVEPEEVVDVGAQVAGQITAFGKDKNGKAIDYGSAVEDGTVLAQIDNSLYVADVEAANAQLQQARANQISAGRQRSAGEGQAGPSPTGLESRAKARTFRSAGAKRL